MQVILCYRMTLFSDFVWVDKSNARAEYAGNRQLDISKQSATQKFLYDGRTVLLY